ncbi:MAG: SusC/RagA family TonB-linked outer membrane protein, partial [Prevotellaceae bacterium]|nr:SusC/RagA family TonB-linked outer membrane protein [Prevotellaceae bacterium]
MRKYKLLIIVFLACLNIPAWAQDVESGITGVVVDKWDHPIYGASIQIAGQPESRVETDRDGNFEIAFIDETVNLEVFATERGTVKAVANPGQPVKVVMGFAGEKIDVGADITFTREQSTASVSTAYTSEFGNRNAKNISNTLYGQGLGLVTLQNGGYYAETNPTFYVRGIQGNTGNNSPLVLVDGIERDMNLVSADEVESVSVLKDAAAVALYGYRGSNGAILITTKRGKYNTKEINISYDHVINYNVRRPKFVDAATYASAVNEARSIAGLAAQYSDNEIAAYQSGDYPYAYPNVDWVNETFRKHGITNKYLVELRGGGQNFRYYTMIDMVNDAGYVKNPHLDSTYSTQDKYSRANLRANMDMDLTSSTKMKVNLMGSLTESLRPGDSVNLWELIYETPANAFPAYADDDHLVWGGNTTGNFLGTANPVAQSQGAGYVKAHSRVFFADMTLSQDLSALTKGLSVNARLGYDNYSNITENHSKTYTYGGYTSTWTSGSEPTVSATTGGEATELGTSAATDAWTRRFNFMLSFDYARNFGGKHDVYGQLKYEYNFNDSYGINTSVYHRDYSFFGHYGYDNRYMVDFVLMGSQSSLLAPDHKWALSPTMSVAWVISNEKFLKNNKYVNFLKFRASAGVISSDNLPSGSTAYNYWDETYGATGSGYYLFGASDGDVSWGNFGLTRFALLNPSHERTYKYNAGFDATLFNGLDVTVEGYFNHRTHEWLDSSGKYTSVIGLNAP